MSVGLAALDAVDECVLHNRLYQQGQYHIILGDFGINAVGNSVAESCGLKLQITVCELQLGAERYLAVLEFKAAAHELAQLLYQVGGFLVVVAVRLHSDSFKGIIQEVGIYLAGKGFELSLHLVELECLVLELCLIDVVHHLLHTGDHLVKVAVKVGYLVTALVVEGDVDIALRNCVHLLAEELYPT